MELTAWDLQTSQEGKNRRRCQMMTFKKNLFALLVALAVSLLAAWVAGLAPITIVYGLTFCIPFATFTLYLADLIGKAQTDRSLLTAEYYWGGVIIFGALVAWFWASMSTTALEQGVRLGVTFLSAVLGGAWFFMAYKHSIQTTEEREAEKVDKFERRTERKWQQLRKKIQKKSKEEAVELLSVNLAYHTVGDTLDGALNFDIPLAVINDEPLTYNQLVGMKEDVNGVVAAKRNAAYQYIQNLVRGKE
jgi:fatty acid desaturase